jgi:hypothetical protein
METIKRIWEQDSYSWGGYAIETDKRTLELRIDNQQDCCEAWGWFFSEDDTQQFIGAELKEVHVVDTALNKRRLEEKIPYGVDEGEIMFVNLETDRGTLQFVAYNCHNGYYGHAAEVRSITTVHNTVL